MIVYEKTCFYFSKSKKKWKLWFYCWICKKAIWKQRISWGRLCDSCKKTKKCIHEDDIAEVLNKVHEADGVAFISPIYFGYPPGTAKILIDRLYAYFEFGKGFEVSKDKVKKMLVAFSFGAGPAEEYDKVAHTTAFNFMVIGVNEHKTIMLGNQNDKKTFSEKVANDSELAGKMKSLFDWLAE